MARPGAVRRPGFWTPTGVTDSREFAEAMARLLGEDPDTEARAVSAYDLMHKIPEQDRDPHLDRLNSRTTAEIDHARALQRTAAMALAAARDRRSGHDRRHALTAP